MKYLLNIIPDKWKWNGILTIGGLLIGLGIADCLFAFTQTDLNQIARGLTIFGAGLTILVVMDNTKTQRATEKIHKETQLQLTRVEDQLNAFHESQQMTEKQLHEIKNLLQKTYSKKST
jgi:hypothetical protein